MTRLLAPLRHAPVSALSVFGALLAWELVVLLFKVPTWLLPAPSAVWAAFIKNHGVIAKHFVATSVGAGGGLAIGALLGVALAVLMVHSRWLERALMPLLIVEQSIPKIALAPLIVIWFGAGMASRVFISMVISFFPLIVNTARGLTTIDSRINNLMHTLSASRWQVLLKLRIPNAVPYIFAGLKSAVPLAIIGAVVAEFVQADSGLGYLVMISVTDINTPMVFVAVMLMAALSLGIFGLVALAERLLLARRFAYLVPAEGG